MYREFIAKLGGYLALDYKHLLLPFQNNHVKIPNESTKSVNIRNITKQNYMKEPKQEDTFERDPLMKSLLTTKILSQNDLNYQVTKIGMGNYYLYENVQPISVSTKKEYEVL